MTLDLLKCLILHCENSNGIVCFCRLKINLKFAFLVNIYSTLISQILKFSAVKQTYRGANIALFRQLLKNFDQRNFMHILVVA